MTATAVSTPTRPGAPSPETLGLVRREVRDLLERSPAFKALPPETQRAIAQNTVDVASYLAEPDGLRLPPPPGKGPKGAPPSRAMAGAGGAGRGGAEEGRFEAQAAMQGAAAAGAYLQAVNFPAFVSGLIDGVFHSIVGSSINQMEAYGKLVADVAKTLNQFRDENTTANQGRDYLVEQFPDTFMIDVDTGAEGGPAPRVRVRDGVDESEALKKVNTLPVEGGPVTGLDDETVETKLVPAARTQLATSRQQLLATMVLMGINRIVVTDGKIAAKVLFDFQARDNMQFRKSATQFDYGDQYKTTGQGEYESDYQGGESSYTYTKDKGYEGERRDASYYSKGTYKTTSEPVLKLASASQTSVDASLSTKASLTGQVEVNFKSDYLPLEKMADSFQIARIQDAARPGPVRASGGPAGSAAPAAGQPPAAGAPKA